MATVKNVGKDQRQFYDRKVGKWIVLNPGESVEVQVPPEENEFIKVLEKEQPKKKKQSMEVD